VSVPQSLKGEQVLGVQIGGSSVVKMHRVATGVAVHPSVAGEDRRPVVVVGSVDGSSSLVVALPRHCRKGNATFVTSQVPLVKHVLLGGRPERRVQRDVITHGSGCLLKHAGGRALQRACEAGAVAAIGVKSSERVTHGVQLRHNLRGDSSGATRRIAPSQCAQNATSSTAYAALKIGWSRAVTRNLHSDSSHGKMS